MKDSGRASVLKENKELSKKIPDSKVADEFTEAEQVSLQLEQECP